MDTITNSPAAAYWHYLSAYCPVPPDAFNQLQADLEETNWEYPETGLDFNNMAVMALIEAEQAEDDALKTMGLEMALEALVQGAKSEFSHPLCLAHLALIRSLVGDSEASFRTAFPTLIDLLQYAYNAGEALPLGLVYLPLSMARGSAARQEMIQHILGAEEGTIQSFRLLAEVLCDCQLVFYNANGKRFLQLAAQLVPDSATVNLKLGLANLMKQQWEGLLNLQQARSIAPKYAPVIQALHLAYRELQPDVAEYWLQYGQKCAQESPQDLAWCWTALAADSPFTYLPLDRTVLMAVDPNIRSIVTSVLLAEGDWFEVEMEFWRRQLQPGMTVIDVGANVGVYTFSAAQQVGPTGQVFAVEPFSGCVRCLEETRRLNQFDWVKICAGAASDQSNTARLALQSASELNEVVTDAEALADGEYEEITCFPLDSLIETGLTRVDWLKIDAEGHEMQVLAGSNRILREFAPAILYENIAGTKGSNTSVAEYLQARGYRLFRYQPFLHNLIPLDNLDELQGNLNIIALPPDQ